MTTVARVADYRLFMLAILFFGISGQGLCQDAGHQAVKSVIETMFDGMREGDSSKVSAAFAKNVQMYSASIQEDGATKLTEGSASRFLTAVGTPHDKVWDEQISNLVIQIDGPLATAWMNYSFYLDKAFSHCGVNAMTLARIDDAWKIIYLIDTRRRDRCE